jgi:ribonuclease R
MGRKRKNKDKHKPKSKTRYNAKELRNQILSFLDSNIDRAYSSKQIIKRLGIRDQPSKAAIQPLLIHLAETDRVEQIRHSYKSKKQAESITGKVDHVNSRFAYVITDSSFGDVWVKTDLLRNAMDGDTVEIAVSPKKHGKRPEGKVVRVVQRGRDELVGRIEFSPRYAFVIADNRKIYHDFFIPLEKVKKAAHNDKVIIKITEWPEATRNPVAEVVRVLGKAGEHETEIHSIMAEFDLPFQFPELVDSEADQLDGKISDAEIKRRRDFRDINTFTIDPADAKDFDDALSVQWLKNGNIEVGVHIADVTHYVSPKTELEKEAVHRATSVYLVDRTIPMLPEKLSNELCSLRPNEDKLTFSAVFELNAQAKIMNTWFGRTIIHSDKRFAYEEAQEVIENKEGPYSKEILTLNKLAKMLKKKRFANGAINFETTEVRFQLDENGKPLGIVPRVRKDAHKLIEEFMLLANKHVAEFVFKLNDGKGKNTFVYRTHDYPDPERIETFSHYAKRFGHELHTDDNRISKSINGLIEEIEGKPEENVLQRLAIRAMAKAKYTTAAQIHFGLAFQHYTHFTSPIRRYPDMIVHRLLHHYLQASSPVKPDLYEEHCQHSSEMEKRAAEAERASIKFKQVEFMRDAEDKDYEGVVSGVTEWGVFVEIVETKCEGMVRVSELTDDFYVYDEDRMRLVGRGNQKIIALGDKCTVRVAGTDIDRRTIDLTFVQ